MVDRRPCDALVCLSIWSTTVFILYCAVCVHGHGMETAMPGQNSTVYVNDSMELYEALVWAETDGKLSRVVLNNSFVINTDVWVPRITLNRSLTIVGGGPDTWLGAPGQVVLLRVSSGRLKLEGFKFRPVVRTGGVEVLMKYWFRPENDRQGLVHYKDMDLEIVGEGGLMRSIDLSTSAFDKSVQNADGSLLFQDVLLEGCKFTNVKIRSIEDSTVGWSSVLPIKFTVDNVGSMEDRLFESQADEGLEVQLSANMTVAVPKAFGAPARLLEIRNPIIVRQTDSSVLSISFPPRFGALRIRSACGGRVHFESVALSIESSTADGMRMDDLSEFFGGFYSRAASPRCLVSLRDSFIVFPRCIDRRRMLEAVWVGDSLVGNAPVLSEGNLGSGVVEIRRFVGSGMCMENVALSCSSSQLSAFLKSRTPREDNPPQESDHLFFNNAYIVMLVLAVILLTMCIIIVAYIRGFGIPRYVRRLKRRVSRVKSGQKNGNVDESSTIVPTASEPYENLSDSESVTTDIQWIRKDLGWPSDWHSTVVGADVQNDQDDQGVVQVEDFVGKGGYGMVYKGTWNGREVAVKTLIYQETPNSANREKERAMLEAGIGSILCHPNIVQTYTYTFRPVEGGDGEEGTSRCKMYMVQEYCDCGSLRNAMECEFFLCPVMKMPRMRCILSIMLDVAEGMRYLHGQNIIHGDLSSKNILLVEARDRESGVLAKICDFGLSVKLREAEKRLYNHKAGTPLYMAPEVGHLGILSMKADVYSFGVVLWELYNSASKSASMHRQNSAMEFPIVCPLPFTLLICLCMSPKPDDRPEFETVYRIARRMIDDMGSASFNQARKMRQLNRKFASRVTACTHQQIVEYLLEGLKMHGISSGINLRFQTGDGHVWSERGQYVLEVGSIYKGGWEFLTLGWRLLNSSSGCVPFCSVGLDVLDSGRNKTDSMCQSTTNTKSFELGTVSGKTAEATANLGVAGSRVKRGSARVVHSSECVVDLGINANRHQVDEGNVNSRLAWGRVRKERADCSI